MLYTLLIPQEYVYKIFIFLLNFIHITAFNNIQNIINNVILKKKKSNKNLIKKNINKKGIKINKLKNIKLINKMMEYERIITH